MNSCFQLAAASWIIAGLRRLEDPRDLYVALHFLGPDNHFFLPDKTILRPRRVKYLLLPWKQSLGQNQGPSEVAIMELNLLTGTPVVCVWTKTS